jgi:hypothetical protein
LILRVVPLITVTVTTSSLEVSGSRIKLNGTVPGKPLADTMATDDVVSSVDADVIELTSVV